MWKHPKLRDILNKLLQLKSFIQEKLPDAEMAISTPTLRSWLNSADGNTIN